MGLMMVTARAVPADPTPVQVHQPDGSTLTVVLHGDEFFNYLTTSDGYTVVKNEKGFYTYARIDGNRLVAGDRVARDEKNRNAADRAALATLPKRLTTSAMIEQGTKMLNRRNGLLRGVGNGGHMDYSKFRGLIILINYTDRKFEDYVPSNYEVNGFYNEMVNSHDYKGYTLASGYKVDMMGSVRDYYYDNSFQQFDPSFDILGPVDVDFSCRDAHQMSNCAPIFYAALEALDGDVDFSQYDTDNDGTVDMVFFLVAGYGSDYSSNDRDYLWPHMYNLEDSPVLDGVNFSLYACSTGMYGAEPEFGFNRTTIAGVGTFCHEFSHVLGLPDLYDTDYAGSGGSSKHPMTWSIMASGFKNNYARNPAGYSLYERYALGFAQPIEITAEDTISIPALASSNMGYRLNTLNADEYFLIENRQAIKWDKNIPGHGMLIFRVDSTNVDVWENNQVNVDPNHMYYQLLRANFNGMNDSGRDPFPGTSNVTSITNATEPSLRTWDGKLSPFAFTGITEADSVITFVVVKDSSKSAIEDFEKMPLGATLNDQAVAGQYANWNFSSCAVVDTAGVVDGHVVAMKNGSMISTAENLNKIPKVVRFTVYNPTDVAAVFYVYYSKNGGTKWLEADYPNAVTVPAGSTAMATVTSLPTDIPIMLRIKQTTGSTTDYCYLDDVTLYYQDTWEPEEPEYTMGDVDGNGVIDIEDVTTLVDYLLSDDYTIPVPEAADIDGDGAITIEDLTLVIELVINS